MPIYVIDYCLNLCRVKGHVVVSYILQVVSSRIVSLANGNTVVSEVDIAAVRSWEKFVVGQPEDKYEGLDATAGVSSLVAVVFAHYGGLINSARLQMKTLRRRSQQAREGLAICTLRDGGDVLMK